MTLTGTASRIAARETRIACLYLCLCALALLACAPVFAQPSDGGASPLRQEYFIEQRAGEALLIRAGAFEATIEGRVFDREGLELLRAEVRATRLAPLFLFVDRTSQDRQLDIELRAPARTDRSRFDIDFSRLVIRDDRSALLASAYRLLSGGLLTPETDSAPARQLQVRDLSRAADIFRRFGMEELRLWSDLHAAALTLHGVGDPAGAVARCQAIIRDDGSRRHPEIRLAALDLQTEALWNLREAGALPVTTEGADPLQESAGLTVQVAATRGEQFVRARALAFSGADFADRDLLRDAFDRFQAALRVTDDIGAGDLGTEIRENLVAIHGTRGEVTQSGEVLREIESQLSEEGQGEELARNLLAQGRLLNRTYRYERARAVLDQALAYQRNSVTESEVRLELARALFETGRLDRALAEARAAVINSASGAYRQPTGLLDLGDGIGIAADVYRERGQFPAMTAARGAQEQHLRNASDRAAWAWERARDGLAAGGGVADRLRRLAASGAEPWRSLAVLQLCAGFDACDDGAASRARERLRLAAPRHRAEGELLWAEWQQRRGDSTGAIRTLAGLLGQVHFLQAELPGVLGAWSWQRGEAMATRYLDLLMGHGSASRALLGLAEVRHATVARRRAGEAALRAAATAGGADTDEFRASLAALEAPGDGSSGEQRQAVIRRLETARREFDTRWEDLSVDGVNRYLAALERDQALVDFHFGDSRAWAFLADRDGVRRVALPASGELAEELFAAGERAAVLDGDAFDDLMARLGGRLLDPLGGALPKRLLWPGSPPLARVPLSALRRNGRYLAQDHELARVPGFPVGGAPDNSPQPVDGARVFLAGDPRDFSSEYLTRLDTSLELRAVANRFVGPGLTMVQGAALLADEFDDPRYGEAELLHLAMPALIDLAGLDASGLQLSEARREAGRGSFSAGELAVRPLSATLAVLSQADWRGRPESSHDNLPPLVADLLQAGSGAVLVSLWPRDDAGAAWFMERFYERLAVSGDAALALAQAQRTALTNESPARAWAGYSLYLR